MKRTDKDILLKAVPSLSEPNHKLEYICVPEEFVKWIKKVIEVDHPELGYEDVSDFLSDAARRRLFEIEDKDKAKRLSDS